MYVCKWCGKKTTSKEVKWVEDHIPICIYCAYNALKDKFKITDISYRGEPLYRREKDG